MKKLLLFFVLTICSAGFYQASASESYFIDDNAVEAVFDNSVNVPLNDIDLKDVSNAPIQNQTTVSEKNGWIAFLLAFLVGGLGIHRFYLGTKTFTGIGYILTCGGIFGIVPFVDWIVLLIGAAGDDIDKYVDNPKFFMW